MISVLPSILLGAAVSTLAAARSASPGDWPMWRYDASRSAASPVDLPDRLGPRWVRELARPQPAWPNERRLEFDASYEPIIMGKTLFVGSPNDGSVTAFDTETGRQRWKHHTEGPVRFAPVAWRGKLYVGSDDGYLYCLEAASGALLWKVRGCPEARPDRRHLGNARLVSYWPVRGGPVLADGTVYFAAGIWPTLGVFLHALDAETGRAKWINRQAHVIEKVRLDHNALHEAGLSPQGYLVIAGDKLVVPNGRSMPARLDRQTGKLLYYVQGYRRGDCRVTALGKHIFVGDGGVVNLHDGREAGCRWVEAGQNAPNRFDHGRLHLFEGPLWDYKLSPACDARSVLSSGKAYGMHQGTVYAYDVDRSRISLYKRKHHQHELEPARWDAPVLWKLATQFAKGKPESTVLMKAGNRLYGHAGKTLLAVSLPSQNKPSAVVWKRDLQATPSSMLAGDGKLFVVTEDGSLHCFAGTPGEPTTHTLESTPLPQVRDAWSEAATRIVERTGVSEGYCLALGIGTGRLVAELLRQTKLHVIAVDADAKCVNALRTELTAAGLYGRRGEAFVGNPFEFHFPPYLASLIVSENPKAAGFSTGLSATALFNVLRPYGGVACLAIPPGGRPAVAKWIADADLPNAEVRQTDRFVLLRRVGALPGSAWWTHESADAARSYFSRDRLVKPPLGVLWYGDGEGYGFYKFKDYGVGVKPQVIGGRLFAYQIFSRTLHAIDVFTGRWLWQTQVEPFTRFASMADGVYVAGKDRCVVHDPATGKPRATFKYRTESDRPPFVSDIRVSDDIILIAVAFAKQRSIEKGLWDSRELVALDRKTGRQLWIRKAAERFNNHAIALGGDKDFCIDSPSGAQTEQTKRRGKKPGSAPSTVMALDAQTGTLKWQAVATNPFRIYPTGHWLAMRSSDDWLAYAEERGVLLTGKQGRMRAYRASDGKELWNANITGGQPIVIRGEAFMNQSGHVFDVDGGKKRSKKPLFARGGCNYAVANEYLTFVRDRCVAYVDVATGESHYLRNIRSGCSNSLIAADGLLNAPCFSVRCICNYPIQTSFAMVHMPMVGKWSGRTEPKP